MQSRFQLIIDTNLPPAEDPNERFQARLFRRYKNALPAVPAMNDLGVDARRGRLKDFPGAIGLDLWGPGGEHSFIPKARCCLTAGAAIAKCPSTPPRAKTTPPPSSARAAACKRCWKNMPAASSGMARRVFFREKPLTGAWRERWGGPAATTLHNSDGWYAARSLVELYRYDRTRHDVRPAYLEAIDQLFNWAVNCVWTRNEFPDVPSSPFAIGGCLKTAFLLDYYFTFKNDPARKSNAELALRMADNVVWRYLPIWAMDSDRYDGGWTARS